MVFVSICITQALPPGRKKLSFKIRLIILKMPNIINNNDTADDNTLFYWKHLYIRSLEGREAIASAD